MKNIVDRLVYTVILIVSFLFGATAFGQEQHPTVLPIRSFDILRNYALTLGRHAYRDVGAESMDVDFKGAARYVFVDGKSTEDVIEQACAVTMVYRMNNPNDTINSRLFVYNEEYDTILFRGYGSYTVEEAKMSPTMTVWMDRIPIAENVQSAEILAMNEDKQTTRTEQLTVLNGKILFPSWYAGAENAVMAVRYKDGVLMTYGLASLNGEQPSVISSLSKYKVEGHYVVDSLCPEGYVCTGQVVEIIETWLRPTVLFRSKTAGTVTFDVIGIVGGNVNKLERPGFIVFSIEGKEGESVVPLNLDRPTEVKLPSGETRIRFIWDKFGSGNQIYAGPEDGGKG